MPGCTKKTKFPSRGAAEWALQRFKVAHPNRRERGVHPCEQCHAWHWTSRKGFR